MNKISLVALIIVIIGILAYFLSPLFITKTVDEPAPIQVTEELIRQGTFADADSFHKVSGQAKIVNSENGRYLRLENFQSTNGPDLKVYFSSDTQASSYVSLGALKGNIGNQNYELPADLDLEAYPYVLIWCEQFSVLFGSAQLSE